MVFLIDLFLFFVYVFPIHLKGIITEILGGILK